jgi:hypothetical protein
MIMHSKFWFPKSDVSISDLEKIEKIKLKRFLNSDRYWIDDPYKTTFIDYIGFDGEVTERLHGQHPHKPYVQRNPKEADHITSFTSKSFDQWSLKAYKSPLIEYLSYELDLEFTEGDVV